MDLDKESVINYLIKKFKKTKKEKNKENKINENYKEIVPFYFVCNFLSVNKYFSTLSVFLEEARINIKKVQNEYISELKKINFSLGFFFEKKTTDFYKKSAFGIFKEFFKEKKNKKFEHKLIQTDLLEVNSSEIEFKLKKIEEKYKKNDYSDFISKETVYNIKKNREDLQNFHKLDLEFIKKKLALKINLEKNFKNN